MTSSHAVIDYFAILGQQKQPGIPLVHKPLHSSFSDDPKETSTASDILNEAITDIAILPNGECVCMSRLDPTSLIDAVYCCPS